ncbi:MAG TPA: DUF1552 domain-containing protein [Fimbriimonadaceae bacterium]|nr:hypothetical protein [Armatimonadota bacterium]HCM74570.1 hypothetical protein [Armatimonadota bacterium]HRD31353.1 DUF1552 domain-containing protein [Fimbriimonadaceae bacterium]HRE93830.1 DUF1552 domain-containing protein [Fimbriimonadaceae bacterium]HRI74219.1 DUF1552 domain-containing protein [Fimbriimonadaceae bacterium]
MREVSRRTVLRGMGVAMAVPFLEGLAPRSVLAVSAPARPVRMAYLFVPNGVAHMDAWRPAASGVLNDLPPILRPLDKVKQHMNVLTGLDQHNANALGDGPGDHARSTATWLTGVHIKKTDGSDIRAGISADQVAAQFIGKQTRFASLEIGCERGAMAGNCDSGYSCAYSSSVSWASESTPVAKEVNPRAVFERLFGTGDEVADAVSRERRMAHRRSILDFVMEDADALRGRLGTRDQQKLDEYLDGVRDIERRIARAETENRSLMGEGIPAPAPGIPRDRGEHIRLLGDMMVLAFQSDLTRICTFMLANDGSNRPFPELNIGDGHHDVSHHGNDPDKVRKKQLIDIFHTQQLAYILERMATTEDGDGTLLDNTMLVYGAGISNGDRHNHDDLPTIVAGRAGGTLRTGRHLVYQQGTPMSNLYVSMLGRVGVPVERLGDSTGPLRELF